MPRTVPTSMYVLLLVILVVADISFYRMLFAPDVPKVSVLATGKESVILVRAQGKTLLIDTGPDASILRALGTALPPWQRKIDAVLLTSPKKASIGGLPDVLNRYTVSQQITLTESRRISLDKNTFIDIVLTQNTPASVYLSNAGTTTKIR